MSNRTHFLRQLGVYGYDTVEPIVLAALVSGDPLLLIGLHGTGKTFLLNSLSEALGLEHRHYNASLVAFDDLVGFPYPSPDGTGIRYLPTPATIWQAESVLIDELNRCKPEHQNRFFSIVHERRIQGLALDKLRYRWAAMNPAGEENGYLGAEPLDPALADRFAFLIKVADWADLTPEDQAAVTDPRGDGAISRDGGKLRTFLEDAGRKYDALLREPPAHVLRYAATLVTALGKAGVRLSPRRSRQLSRNLLATLAVSSLPAERLFRLAVRCSAPHLATGEPLSRETLDAAHAVAWNTVGLVGAEKWLHQFAIETELVKKLRLLLNESPDPDTATVAIAQLIASETPPRIMAFVLAVHPFLIEHGTGRVTATGISDLAQVFELCASLSVEILWRDPARPRNADGTKHHATVPGYDAAVQALQGKPKERLALALQYLDCLVALGKAVPEDWTTLLGQFETCLDTVGEIERTLTAAPPDPQPAPDAVEAPAPINAPRTANGATPDPTPTPAPGAALDSTPDSAPDATESPAPKPTPTPTPRRHRRATRHGAAAVKTEARRHGTPSG
jgi:MoxR-like ATPase